MSRNTASTDGITRVHAQRNSVGQILVGQGKLREEDTDKVIELQQTKRIKFGEAASELGLVSQEDIAEALAVQSSPTCPPIRTRPAAERLLAAARPRSVHLEPLRVLRGQLARRWFLRGKRTLAISRVGRDDAGVLAANLAVLFAQVGWSTVLVDANLRQPAHHQIFNAHKEQGLSDILSGAAPLDSAIHFPELGRLSLITAGTTASSPLDLVSQPSFSILNKSLAERYEVVLYDLPPLNEGWDGLEIAACVGAVLLIVEKNSASLEELQQIKNELDALGVEVVGSVLMDASSM